MRGSDSVFRLLALAALLAPCSCSHESGAGAQPLQVDRVSPQPPSPDAVGRLFLNQELTVYFNQPIERLSVTTESVQVLDEDGHPARGRLSVGSHSVTFVPEPPLEPGLLDGSFKPDRSYRLVVWGPPRFFTSIQSESGRILSETVSLRYRTVPAEPEGFPSALLPVETGTEPFDLRNSADARPLPVGDPRLQLHFTLPVLPTSLTPGAFDILLVRGRGEKLRIVPRGLRIMTWPPPVDEYPGCTVELDLGRQVIAEGMEEPFALEPTDFVYVGLTTGPGALVDYRGRPARIPPGSTQGAQFFRLVHGNRLPLVEWPAEARAYVDDDPVLPGFEVLRDNTIRPRVRVEAGSGELGVFRPSEDVVLDPERPFVRDDGQEIWIEGRAYPFLAVDIPAGVEVTLRGEDVRILSCGSIRIGGVLRISNARGGILFRTGEPVPPDTLLAGSAVALVAAGDIRVSGEIATAAEPAVESSSVTLLAGGRIELLGPIPPRAVLAVEPGLPRTVGPAQQPVTVVTSMTPGVPAGKPVPASGWTDWQRIRPGVGPVLQARIQADEGIGLAYQTASPDSVRPDAPDVRPGVLPPRRAAEDGTVMQIPEEGFVRFFLHATVQGGSPLPRLQSLRIVGQ